MRIGMMAMMITAVGLNFCVVGCSQNASEKRRCLAYVRPRVRRTVAGRARARGVHDPASLAGLPFARMLSRSDDRVDVRIL